MAVFRSEKRGNAGDDTLADDVRALAPGDDAIARRTVLVGKAQERLDRRLGVEVAIDIGPAVRARERDRARALADRETLDRLDGEAGGERGVG
jgi:hypothetical protein